VRRAGDADPPLAAVKAFAFAAPRSFPLEGSRAR